MISIFQVTKLLRPPSGSRKQAASFAATVGGRDGEFVQDGPIIDDPGELPHLADLSPTAQIERAMPTDALESRVSRLEQDMHEVRGVLARLEPMIVRIDERTNHLPSHGFVITTILAVVMLVVAVIALGPQLQNVVGGLLTSPAEAPRVEAVPPQD